MGKFNLSDDHSAAIGLKQVAQILQGSFISYLNMQKELFFRVLNIVAQYLRPWIEEQERWNMAHEELMQCIREIGGLRHLCIV